MGNVILKLREGQFSPSDKREWDTERNRSSYTTFITTRTRFGSGVLRKYEESKNPGTRMVLLIGFNRTNPYSLVYVLSDNRVGSSWMWSDVDQLRFVHFFQVGFSLLYR